MYEKRRKDRGITISGVVGLVTSHGECINPDGVDFSAIKNVKSKPVLKSTMMRMKWR